MPVPVLSYNDRMAALAKARIARHMVSETRKALKEGRTTVANVLESENIYVRRMRVLDVLACGLPGVGKVRARMILEEAEVKEWRRISGLTLGQRERIDAAIHRRS